MRSSQSEEDSGGESSANGNVDEREASGQLEPWMFFGGAESEQKLLCRASRGSPWQRSGTQAFPFRNWPSLICTQRCSLLCGSLGDAAVR